MSHRSALGLAVAALLCAACGEIPEPESFAIATTTSLATDATVLDGANEAAAAVQSESPVTTEFVPSRSDEYVPEVLISTSLEVLSADGVDLRSLTGAFSGLSTERAVDDLLGGLVVQRQGATAGGDGEVVWFSAEGGDPTTIDDNGARLLDVGYVGGSPSAVVLVGDDQVDRIRLVDNERTMMVTLDEGEEVLGLSASGGLHALVLANEQCGDLRFYAADGMEIDLNGPGEPDCIVPRRAAYGAVGLSPDGGAIVYTQVSYRDDGIEVATELVARELSTGIEFFRRKIGEDGDRVTALSFDGQRVAYLRTSDSDYSVVVLDLSAEQEAQIDLAGVPVVDSVSFARLPLAGS